MRTLLELWETKHFLLVGLAKLKGLKCGAAGAPPFVMSRDVA